MDDPLWLFVFELAQAVGGIASVVVAAFAVRVVQRYTQEKDEADFHRSMWAERAQVNLACLQDERIMAAFEKVVYGKDYEPITEDARMRFVLFVQINQVHHLYIAFKHRVMDVVEYENSARESLRLLKRQESIVVYLLTERGYSPDFRREVMRFLAEVSAPALPISTSSAGPA